MRLLITTQVLDKNDSDLGFFHRWIEEFAGHCERVDVICLRAGIHSLPKNVYVHVLGKNKLLRATKLLRLARTLNYDAVFVHMNPEYIVVLGWLWKILGKKVGLWYTHKSVNLKLRIAEKFADVLFTASKESFRLPSKKVHVVGHGIDTDFFTPDPSIQRGTHILSVGRLMKSKRHDLAIRMALDAHQELYIAGEGPERDSLESLAREVGARVVFLGGLNQEHLRDEYRKAAYLIHTSETGSLDKVVLEALACGLPVRTNNLALKELESKDADYVRREHSLTQCVKKILDLFSGLD